MFIPLSAGAPQEVDYLIDDSVYTLELNLAQRSLEVVPKQVFTCAGLVILNLQSNALSELPVALTSLATLTDLDVSCNKLSTLPSCIGALSSLTSLRAGYNQLGSLTPQICQLRSLVILHLHDNQLTQLPSQLSCLSCLESLQLQYNQLSQLPCSLSALTQLTELDIEGNSLSHKLLSAAQGGVPYILQQLSAMAALPCTASSQSSSTAQPSGRSLVTSQGHPGAATCSSSGGAGSGVNSPAQPSSRSSSPSSRVRAAMVAAAAASPPGLPRSPAHNLGATAPPSLPQPPRLRRLSSNGAQVLVLDDGRVVDGVTVKLQDLHMDSDDPDIDLFSHPAASSSHAAVQQGEAGSELGASLDASLAELAELPPGAAAVLYRSMTDLSTGVQEVLTGRPLSRGGTSEGGVRPGTALPPGTARPSSTSSRSRPWSASTGGAGRPRSAGGRPPRPGTRSSRPGSACGPGPGTSRLGGDSGEAGGWGGKGIQEPGLQTLLSSQGKEAAAAGRDASSAPLTFPLAAGIRALVRGSSPPPPAVAGAPASSASMRRSSDDAAHVSSRASEAANGVAGSAGHQPQQQEVDLAVVRQLLVAKNPTLLQSLNQVLEHVDDEDGDEDEEEQDDGEEDEKSS